MSRLNVIIGEMLEDKIIKKRYNENLEITQ